MRISRWGELEERVIVEEQGLRGGGGGGPGVGRHAGVKTTTTSTTQRRRHTRYRESRETEKRYFVTRKRKKAVQYFNTLAPSQP